MKTSKTPDKLAKNASKLHKRIGELLTNCEMFKNYEIRQEYRVSAVNPDFNSNKEKFDWAILGANIVIECHGKQHYQKTRFGGTKDDEKTTREFIKLKDRDEKKKQAAEEAGWAYVVVSYQEENITEEELLEKIRIVLANIIVKKSFNTMTEIIKKGHQTKVNKSKSKIQNCSNWSKGQKIPSRLFSKKPKEKNDQKTFT